MSMTLADDTPANDTHGHMPLMIRPHIKPYTKSFVTTGSHSESPIPSSGSDKGGTH